jgi:quinol-cytochrome oxidoreductase complex cytochrome b subunit
MERMKHDPEPFFSWALVEKIIMVSLISIIFAQVLPDVRATNLELAVGVAFVIAINTLVSHWFARRGTEWTSIIRQFIVMAVINFGSVLLYSFLLPAVDEAGSINLGNTLFFVLLLTLLVVLFDRYRAVYVARFAAGDSGNDGEQSEETAVAAA